MAAVYRFGVAIADGWLSDYRLAVIGVSTSEALALLAEQDVRYVAGTGEAPLQVLAAQVALLRARQQYRVQRAITFHARIADGREFARSLPATVTRFAPGDAATLTARHMSGEMDTRQRRVILDALRRPPGDGWVIVSNARCLGEGVDIPAVDAVCFAHPKRSAVDIVQAVGRALRRSRVDGDEVATIIVPIVVDDRAGAATDLDPGAYRVLWDVARALRAHDEDLGVALDLQRSKVEDPAGLHLPDKITVTLPPGAADHVLHQLTLMLVKQTSSSWWENYGAARRWHAQHGHLRVPREYVEASTGVALGTWIMNLRTVHGDRGERLAPERRTALDDLGMLWHVYDAAWEDMYARAQRYHAEHGHLRMRIDHTVDGHAVGRWLGQQRTKAANGTLRADRAGRLAALGMQRHDAFAVGIAAADRYLRVHGHLRVPENYVDETGYRLGAWVSRQRSRALGRKVGSSLTDEQRAALDQRGMVWAQRRRDLTAAETAKLQALGERGRRAPELSALLVRLADEGVSNQALARVLGGHR